MSKALLRPWRAVVVGSNGVLVRVHTPGVGRPFDGRFGLAPLPCDCLTEQGDALRGKVRGELDSLVAGPGERHEVSRVKDNQAAAGFAAFTLATA